MSVGVVLLILVWSTVALAVLALAAVVDGYLRPERVSAPASVTYPPIGQVAALIASKNGSGTIGGAVRAAAANGVDVYVVSDGSEDDTADVARAAGATVLALPVNVGKPSALHEAYHRFELGLRYDAVAILDDDVIVEADFVRRALAVMKSDVAIAVGRNLTEWPEEHRWNALLASRAYSYWSYQAITRRVQSWFNVMNCISGSNSLFRTEVLDRVLTRSTPYIVDDTYWTLETHRLRLGRIAYAPRARAWLQDPMNYHDWYRQNLRWLWGTFQGIIGHRCGTKATRFHVAYLFLMLQWLVYVLSAPVTIWMFATQMRLTTVALLLSGYVLWVAAASVALHRPRLVLFVPVIIGLDFVYRWIFVHGLIKAIRQPTVKACVWCSPTRFDNHEPSRLDNEEVVR